MNNFDDDRAVDGGRTLWEGAVFFQKKSFRIRDNGRHWNVNKHMNKVENSIWEVFLLACVTESARGRAI